MCLLYHSHGEDEEVEQKKQIKPCIPPAKAEGNLLTQLLDPPMVLMIQTELCEKKTLKSWLSDHINDRKRRTVVNFFEQVHLLITCTMYMYMYIRKSSLATNAYMYMNNTLGTCIVYGY